VDAVWRWDCVHTATDAAWRWDCVHAARRQEPRASLRAAARGHVPVDALAGPHARIIGVRRGCNLGRNRWQGAPGLLVPARVRVCRGRGRCLGARGGEISRTPLSRGRLRQGPRGVLAHPAWPGRRLPPRRGQTVEGGSLLREGRGHSDGQRYCERESQTEGASHGCITPRHGSDIGY
jgi:hypothetical protein